MANKKTEFLATIKPILDKSQAKKDAKELALELQDVLGEQKIGFGADSLKQLGELFNEKLKEVGKQPITFTDIKIDNNALKEITSRFAKAISEGINASLKMTTGEGVIKQIEELKIKKQAAQKKAQTANKRHNEINFLAQLYDKEDYDGERFKELWAMDIKGDIDVQAKELMKAFTNAEDKLKGMTKGTKEYNAALVDAYSAAKNLFMMSKTINENKGQVKDKSLIGAFDFDNITDVTYDLFKNYDDYFKKFAQSFALSFAKISTDIATEIKNLDAKIAELEQNNIELLAKERAKAALKSQAELDEAYSRITTKKDKKLNAKGKNIASALEFKGGQGQKSIVDNLSKGYSRSVESGESWEEQYVWLVKFVKEYEAYRSKYEVADTKTKNNMKPTLTKYEGLYNELVPKLEYAEQSLKSLIGMANGKGSGGIVGAGNIDVGNAENLVVANREAAEEAERMAKAEKEAADAAERRASAEREAVQANLKTSAELGKQKKLLLYRRVDGDFDPKLLGGRSEDDIGDIRNTIEFGMGGFGDGTFASSRAGAYDLAASAGEDPTTFFEFDASEYNLYVNRSLEQAEKLRSLLLNLQRVIGDGKPFKFSDQVAEEVGTLNIEQMFGLVEELFGDVFVEFDEFRDWIENARFNSMQMHKDLADGKPLDNYHNFGTRFMKYLGYEGILNDVKDDPEYSGDYQGSVIFDPKVEKMLDYINQPGHLFKSIGDYVKHLDIEGFKELVSYISASGQAPDEFFDGIIEDSERLDENLKYLLQSLGFMGDEFNATFKSIDSGNVNNGGAVSDGYTLISRDAEYLPKTTDLMPKLSLAKEMGANVGQIFDFIYDEANEMIYEIQQTVSGSPITLTGNSEFLEATDEQIEKLIKDLEILRKTGLYIDFGGDNIFYDKEKGFSFIDLATRQQEGQETLGKTLQSLISFSKPGYEKDARFTKFAGKLHATHKNMAAKKPAVESVIKPKAKVADSKDVKPEVQSKKEEVQTQEKLNDAVNEGVEGNKKHINTYKELCDVVAQYIQLAQNLQPTSTAAFDEAQRLASQANDDADYYDHERENILKAVGNQYENIKRIDAAKKAGVDRYTTSDGYTRLVSDFDQEMKRARDILYGHIYNAVDYMYTPEEIGGAVKGKNGKSIAKVAEKYIDISTDNDQYEKIAEQANKSLEDIMDAIYESLVEQAGVQGGKVESQLDELRRWSKDGQDINRHSRSVATNTIGAAIGINTPYKDIEANAKRIETYEELCDVVERFDKLNKNSVLYTGEGLSEADEMERHGLLARLQATGGSNIWRHLNYGGSSDIDKLAQTLGITVPKAAETAKEAVDGLNTSLENQQKIEQADNSPTQTAETQAETAAIEQQNDALKENINLKEMVENAIENGKPGQSVAEVSKVTSDTNNAVAGVNMQELQNILSAITYNVNVVGDDAEKTENKVAIDETALEATLNKVFANIINPTTEQNDGDNQLLQVLTEISNKAGEHIAQEKTLQEIGGKLDNVDASGKSDSNDEQTSSESSYALETTLQTVKGVLDAIQVNTAKIGAEEAVATVSDDSVLTSIHTAVESINKKIVQGTKVLRTSDKKKTEEKSADLEIKNPKELGKVKATKVDTRVKALEGLYEQRGRLLAQNYAEPDNETTEKINQLNKEIQLKFKELGLEGERKKALKESLMIKQEEAKQSEANLIIARQADKAAKDKAKSEQAALKKAEKDRAKNERDALKAEMKEARNQSRIAKAGSVWRSGKDAHGLTMNMVDEAQGISIDDVIDNPEVSKLYDELEKLANAQKKVNDQINANKAVTDEDAIALQKQTAATQQQINVVKDLQKNYEFFSGDSASSLNAKYSGGNLESELKQAILLATQGKAKFHEYNATLGQWTYSVNGANNQVKNFTGGLRQLDGELMSVHTSTKKTEGLLEAIGRKVKEVFTYFSGSSMIYKVVGELRKGIQYIREIDSALTELKKVTDETEETYDKFLKTAAKTADRVGSTIKDVVSSTADWARLGYSMREAAELAESTQILMNVSEFTDVSQATDSLISSVQAFKYTAEESMDVVDILNTIGNNYAISTADLAKSLTKSSASLVAANGTLEEAVALTATANKIVQDADSVGTALKTTSLRLRGTEVSVLEEEGLDSDGAVTSKSKLQSKVKALSGVDILTESGEYKSTYQILSQIADVWKDISDIDQAALLELIAGKRNSSVVAALLQNPEELKAAYEDAANAEGSALKENEKYLDSIQGKIDQFNNAVQSMWSNALDSEVVKGFIEIATALVKAVDAVHPLTVAFAGLFALLAKKSGIFSNMFGSAIDNATDLRQQLKLAEQDVQKKQKLHNVLGTAESSEALEKSKKYYTGLQEQVKPYDEIDQLKREKREWQDALEGNFNATTRSLEGQNARIEARLNNTNKKLAEAEARLAKIDSTYVPSTAEIETMTVDRDVFAREVEAMKAKRDELYNAVKADSSDDVLKLITVDTQSIDDEIAVVENKLQEAQQKLLNAQAEPTTIKVKGGARINRERTQHIQDASQEISNIEKDLDALQKKKADTIHYVAQFDLAEMDTNIDEASNTLNGMTAAIAAKTAAQQADNIVTNAGTVATELKTASTFKELGAQIMSGQVTKENLGVSLKNLLVTKLANTALGAKIAAVIGVTTAELANIPVTQLLTIGFTELAGAIWTALAPLLPFIAIAAGVVVAIVGIVHVIDAVTTTTKEYREELEGVRSELSDLSSEINSVNEELKTTQDRMAELLAKDSLSFTEQEELDRLEEQNDLLERELYLLEQREKRLQRQAENAFDGIMKKGLANAKRDMDGDGEEDDVFDRSIERRIEQYQKRVQEENDAQAELLDAERELEKARESGDTSKIAKAERKVKRKENKLKRKEQRKEDKRLQIDEELDQYLADAEGIDYETADTQTKAYLDYLNNTVGKLSIIDGDPGAKSAEIKRIFNKDSLSDTSKEIDSLVAQLKEDPGNKTIIDKISEKCKDAQYDLQAVGLSVQDAVDYFTMSGNSSAKGIMDQYNKAIGVLNELKNGQIQLSDYVVYDSTRNEATADVTAIAEKLKGTSPEVREQFAEIVEEIREGKHKTEDGLTDWDSAIKTMQLKGMQAVIENVKADLEEANKLAFKDLEITGLLDSTEELSGAFEQLASSIELVAKAEDEMANHGRISLKTALELMSTTDDWTKILEVNNGVITMNANAEEILVQSKLDLIKANIETALSEVDTQIALMEGAINSQEAGNTFTEGFTNALLECQGVLVGLKAGWDAFWSGKNVADAFNNARDAALQTLKPTEEDLGDLYKKREELEKKKEMLVSVDTTVEFKDNYDFDDDNGSFKDALAESYESEMSYWENRISANQAKYEQIQNDIDLVEAKGGVVGKEYYEGQVGLEEERLSLLEDQKKAAQLYLGTLEEGSEEWWDVASTLNNIESEIDDVTSSIVDLQDAIGEAGWYKFEEFNSRVDSLKGRLETMRDLIAPNSEEDWFDDEGNWTEKGTAVLGTYVQEYRLNKDGLDEANKELAEFQAKSFDEANAKWFADNYGVHSEQEYHDYLQKLIDEQYNYATAVNDTEQSIADMYSNSIDAAEEYVNTLVDGYNDYIDTVKDALDAERDLYDFKKNVQKQTKDIATLERRIASLSGSANASDIAERRRLEAELAEQREALNDTYYEHSIESQQEALDQEAQAYEETMNKFIEGLRENLDVALENMDSFVAGVTTAVTANAPTILGIYKELDVAVDDALLSPWQEISNEMDKFTTEGGLAVMNSWVESGGIFDNFADNATNYLSSIWDASNIDPNDAFANAVTGKIEGIKNSIQSNVSEIKESLEDMYADVQDTDVRPSSPDDNPGGGGVYNPSDGNSMSKSDVAKLQTILNEVFGEKLGIDGDYGPATTAAVKKAQAKIGANADGYYGPATRAAMADYINTKWMSEYGGSSMYGEAIRKYLGKLPTTFYAKGTLGTKRDEWAYTDEPWLGDELVLVPGANGNLQYMRKGTAVMPADISANLIEWGKLDPGMLKMGGGANVNIISNAINKPEINLSFDALVKAERIDEGTLPEVKKFVHQELNNLVKQMNYSLKGHGAK